MSQSFENHAHRPTPTIIGVTLLLVAVVAFALRWFEIGGRASFAAGLLALIGAIFMLLAISRVYTTALQDRIIRLEMQVRAMTVLTPPQQAMLAGLSPKQIAALRFASNEELPSLVQRTATEQLKPADIKRAIQNWVPDFHRT